MSILHSAQTDNNIGKGNLSISVTSDITSLPIENAKISISYTGEPNSINTIYKFKSL